MWRTHTWRKEQGFLKRPVVFILWLNFVSSLSISWIFMLNPFSWHLSIVSLSLSLSLFLSNNSRPTYYFSSISHDHWGPPEELTSKENATYTLRITEISKTSDQINLFRVLAEQTKKNKAQRLLSFLTWRNQQRWKKLCLVFILSVNLLLHCVVSPKILKMKHVQYRWRFILLSFLNWCVLDPLYRDDGDD